MKILIPTVLLAIGVALVPPAFGQKTETKSVDLTSSQAVDATIRFNAGTIRVSPHGGKKVESRFTYSRESWKPNVRFTAGNGRLSIEQPEEDNVNMQDKEKNDWDIKWPREVPTSLRLRMGAGEGNLNFNGAQIKQLELEAGAGQFTVNLANTSIAKLKVNAGVGKLNLDLGGSRTTNLDASINGGIGQISLVLPRKTGVRVRVNGLGDVDYGGLKRQGNYYVNDAYGKSAHSLDVSINGGLGNLEITLEK